jgi:hypothetical protein
MLTNGNLYVRWPRLVTLDHAPELSRFQREHTSGTSGVFDVEEFEGKGWMWGFEILFGKWVPSEAGEEIQIIEGEKSVAESAGE